MPFIPALVIVLYGLSVGPRFDRYVLPAFDGCVYDAMAENPRVFTLAPWGYRILTPWIVHFLPFSSAAVGFFWLSLTALSAAVFLTGRWLVRLGFSPLAVLTGGLTLAITPPIRAVLNYQVLVDPLTLFLTVLILNELRNPRLLTLAALFAVSALAKEMGLAPLIVVPFVLASRVGWKRAIPQSLGIAAPALLLLAILRLTWGGPSSPSVSLPDLASLWARAGQIPLTYLAVFGGLSLVAMVGLIQERSVEIRGVGALLWLGNFAAVLINPYGFASPDLQRVSLFAWIPLLPVALRGLGFARDEKGGSGEPPPRPRPALAILALVGSAALVLATDSYRRAPFGESPNPIALLARSREGLKTARALDDGETFSFDAESGRFAAPILEPFNLTEGRRHRWFLYSGFGKDAAFETGAPPFDGAAELLLPVLSPRAARLSIEISGPPEAEVTASVAGQEIGKVRAGAGPASLSIPAGALFRGDNIVRLRGPDGVVLQLRRFEARLQPDP